jgi:hypothetical protein
LAAALGWSGPIPQAWADISPAINIASQTTAAETAIINAGGEPASTVEYVESNNEVIPVVTDPTLKEEGALQMDPVTGDVDIALNPNLLGQVSTPEEAVGYMADGSPYNFTTVLFHELVHLKDFLQSGGSVDERQCIYRDEQGTIKDTGIPVEEVDAVRQQNKLMPALQMKNKDGEPAKRTKYNGKDMPPDNAKCMGLTLKFSYSDSAKATTHDQNPLCVLHDCVQKYSENFAGSAALKLSKQPDGTFKGTSNITFTAAEYSFSWTGTSRPIDLPSSLEKFDVELRLATPGAVTVNASVRLTEAGLISSATLTFRGTGCKVLSPATRQMMSCAGTLSLGDLLGVANPATAESGTASVVYNHWQRKSPEADQDVENQPVVIAGGTGAVTHRVDIINGEEP